jgi:hypothetical protein
MRVGGCSLAFSGGCWRVGGNMLGGSTFFLPRLRRRKQTETLFDLSE